MTNLEKLHASTENLSLHERNMFDDYFIGALSALVSDDDWKAAMKSAMNCLNRNHPAKAVQS